MSSMCTMGEMSKNKAVVLGLGINGLGVVRSLGKNGVDVVGFFQSDGDAIGRHSKYVKSIEYASEDELLTALLKYAAGQKKPVLFCTSDKHVKFVINNKNVLEKLYFYNWEEVNLYKKILDKGKYLELIDQMDVPYPESITFKGNNQDINNELSRLQCPCIVKPITAGDNPIIGSEKNKLFHSKKELISFLGINRKHLETVMIQEVIPHEDSDVFYCTGYIDKNGILEALFSARKIRQYLPGFGVTSFAVSKKNRDVECLSIKALKNLNFKGLFDIEFIYDSRDCQYKYIEINPRTHLANSHSTDSGINLPFSLYNDFLGIHKSSLATATKQIDNIYWVNLDNDMGAFYRKKKNGEIYLMQWLLSVSRARSYAAFDKTDLFPFFYKLRELMMKFFIVQHDNSEHSFKLF